MINRLKYNNELLNEKVNFFWDYYDLFISLAGQLWNFELENPLSLVQKIVFQLDHNIFHAHNYVPTYFDKLAKYDRKYLNVFKNIPNIHRHLREFKKINPLKPKQLPEYRKKWFVNNRASLLVDFELLNSELQKSMLYNSVNGLIQLLQCSHPLSEHKEDIRFHATIIGSECLFTKKERKQPKRLISLINTSDYRPFPYPEGIVTQEQRKKYFSQKDFNKTYKGILDFVYVPTDIQYIICKVENLIFSNKDFFKFGGVTFCSKDNKLLKELPEFLKEHDSGLPKAIYKNVNFSLAVVEVVPQDFPTATKIAIKKVDKALFYLNNVLETAHTVDRKNILFTSDFSWYGYNLSPNVKQDKLTKDDLDELNDNAYYFFEDKMFLSKDAFLQHEMEFILARKASDIYGLWRYLEILLFDRTKETNKIKRYIADALVLSEKKFFDRYYNFHLKTALQDSTPEQLGITSEEHKTYWGKKYKISGKENVKSEFFRDLYSQSKTHFTQKTRQKISDYYYTILTEAYEQRNSIAHSGISQERAITKMEFSFNNVVTRFRWLIFDYMKNNQRATLNEIFNMIKFDASKQFPFRN
ncbi:hypothetical protein SAMN05518672_108203 [Chitinophaga sp. CF118]|uniref:hypothetical protein n=1 Tax=Chitinophaga sp. CF118 TaxID=1884367 RepID=UPI0008E62224|nr:hypothetical protein [Chitinophaga sp. CF118]SFE63981.1 hypothetical protein SAMN05518672_108203 [Chitinophaga sp. CF118]